MAANRVGRRQGRGGSPRVGGSPRGGGSPCRPPPPPRSPALQRRPARVTVKYNRRELQRRLDTELWIDRRLAELYRGRVRDLPGFSNGLGSGDRRAGPGWPPRPGCSALAPGAAPVPGWVR
uniref:Uncharacterized protein n=1 Tax=Falco tinnunculus TaxID=100819 RepID=A0A8C4TUA3_FALTI